MSQTVNSNIQIIGVTGRKRSGKDTIGSYLVEKYGFVRVAYADALKEACKNIFGFSDEQLYGDDLKEVVDEYWGHTPREILQKVGTELFRERLPQLCTYISNDIWIRSVERKIQNLAKQGVSKIVITDIRFPNEIEFITRSGGVTWKVVRPGLFTDSSSPVHTSETLTDTFVCDHEFVNNSSLEILYAQVDSEMQTVLKV